MIAMNIPFAKDIDYTNVDEICGYQMLLCKIFEKAGGFNVGIASNKEIIMVRREGMIWLRDVKSIINNILSAPIPEASAIPASSPHTPNLKDVPRLLASYDFFYRVCHRGPCFTFVRDTTIKTVDRWTNGDRSISKARVALLMLKEINRDIRAIPQRYVDFGMRVLESWINELRRYGRLQDLSQEDSYLVISFLLWYDLYVFGVSKDERIKWIETYTLSVCEIENLDERTLWAYMDFDQRISILMRKSIEEQDERYTRFISKIAIHPDTNRFLREAIELDLAKHKVA